MEKGTLVRWIENKGFGFIKPDNGKSDIFIHVSALREMISPPVIGDVIYSETGFGDNGKVRAINAKIEGVPPALSLTPIRQKSKSIKEHKAETRSRISYLTTRYNRPKDRFNFFSILSIIIAAVFIFNKLSNRNSHRIKQIAETEALPLESTQHFQCEGKVYCSEMSSYEEALFYLNNCPGTKMDGDNDGEPCERQFGQN